MRQPHPYELQLANDSFPEIPFKTYGTSPIATKYRKLGVERALKISLHMEHNRDLP